MNAIGNYIPLSSGSVIYLEPDTTSFSPSDFSNLGLGLATYFLGRRTQNGEITYNFGSELPIPVSIPGLRFQFPDPVGKTSLGPIRSLAKDLADGLKGKNLLIIYPAEWEDRLREILSLILVAVQPSLDNEFFGDLSLPLSPFQSPVSDWKRRFLELELRPFQDKIRRGGDGSLVQVEPSYGMETKSPSDDSGKSYPDQDPSKNGGAKNSNGGLQPGTRLEISGGAPGSDNGISVAVPIDSIGEASIPKKSESPVPGDPSEKLSEIKTETIPSRAPSSASLTGDAKGKEKPESVIHPTKPSGKSEPKSESVEIPAAKIEEVSKEKEEISQPSESQDMKARFSIQVKMMGIISLILVATASTLIGFATYYYKSDASLRVQQTNLDLVKLTGLKVSADIQTIVTKAEQLISSLNRGNLSGEDKTFLLDLFFSNDKDYLYVGLIKQSDGVLESEKSFINEEALFESNIAIDEISNILKRNESQIQRAFSGKPIVLNSSPGFSIPSFILALPANQESKEMKLLVIIAKADLILPAFQKSGFITTYMVNDEGVAIAHPVPEVVQSATSFIEIPIVKNMLSNQFATGQLRYLDKNGKAFLGSFQKLGFGDAAIISTVSEDKAFEAVYYLTERTIYMMAISLCLALIIVFFFAKSLSKPILSLLYATLEIAKGNFRVGIKPTTRDEVGLLTNYFITMGEGLEEREKVKSILGSMIDPVVVKEAMIDLAALKRGKEAEITSFFSDVASFSTISEQLSSVDLASLLNEYLSAMTIILKENDGVLDKYIGDAIVGIFGAPVDVDRHAFKACKASLEMIQKLADLRAYWQKNNLYSKEAQIMDARIGLNTGPAKVGFMGTDALASYTMMGDTVNLAARLEAAGKDYGVNIMIAEQTKQRVESDFVLRILDLVRVKGKNEPVRVYELVGFLDSTQQNIRDSVGFYQQGFDLYLKMEWDRAIQSFEKAIQAKSGKDKSSSMLIARCQEYKQKSPGKDWDGVFTRTTK
jgi:adenylate cyclase